MKYFHLLADTAGFEEQGDKIEACSKLARHYATQGNLEKARGYLWRALVYTRQTSGNDAAIAKELDELNQSPKEHKPSIRE